MLPSPTAPKLLTIPTLPILPTLPLTLPSPTAPKLLSLPLYALFILQDWFNKKLKQLVFDLANQEGASSSIHISTDGGGMSMMRGVVEAGSISGYSMDDPERQNIDLMQ